MQLFESTSTTTTATITYNIDFIHHVKMRTVHVSTNLKLISGASEVFLLMDFLLIKQSSFFSKKSELTENRRTIFHSQNKICIATEVTNISFQ